MNSASRLSLSILVCLFMTIPPQMHAQCSSISISVSSSDTSSVQLYHPGFFVFGATENEGGFETECTWSVTSMTGEMIHEEVTTGAWEDQSFTLFEHTTLLQDSMLVELRLSNPQEAFDCCMLDTLVWEEDEIFGVVFGGWSIQDVNLGQDCDSGTGISQMSNLTEVSLYPNPATHAINLSGRQEITRVDIFSPAGACVKSVRVTNTGATIQVADLPTGIYTALVFGPNRQPFESLRFVKGAQ